MPLNNEERANHAFDALNEYLESKGESIYAPDEEILSYEISDLICDLLHLGDKRGFNYAEQIDRALKHYREEL